MSERSGGREQSEQSGASERAVRANGRASGPVLTSLFSFVPNHSAPVDEDAIIGRVKGKEGREEEKEDGGRRRRRDTGVSLPRTNDYRIRIVFVCF